MYGSFYVRYVFITRGSKKRKRKEKKEERKGKKEREMPDSYLTLFFPSSTTDKLRARRRNGRHQNKARLEKKKLPGSSLPKSA